MKRLLAICLILCFAASVHAAILRVNGGSGTFPDIVSAIGAASPNDTIIISPSVAEYSLSSQYVYLDRPIHIIGGGWPTAQNVGTTINMGQSCHIVLSAAASGSSIESILFSNSPINSSPTPDTSIACIRVDEGCQNVVLHRLAIENLASYENWINYYCNYATSILIHGSNVSCRISQCAIYRPCRANGNAIGTGISITSHGGTLVISNCLLNGLPTGITGDFQTSFQVSGCVFWNASFNGSSLWTGGINNCITNSTISPGTTQWGYNAGTGSPVGLGWLTISTSPFVNLPYACWNPNSDDTHLAPGSSCIDAGVPNQTDRDGSRVDLGIYGGQSPFVDSGIPNIPIVTGLSVPATVPQNGVLPIYSTGRVGPGN